MSRPFPEQLCREIGAVLSPDLLTSQWKQIATQRGTPGCGHCYAASEALHHLLGGKESGWIPQVIRLNEKETHWFLRHGETGKILDPTAAQFAGNPPSYEQAHGCGFLTKEPSHRAKTIIDRVQERLENREAMASMVRSHTFSSQETHALMRALSR